MQPKPRPPVPELRIDLTPAEAVAMKKAISALTFFNRGIASREGWYDRGLQVAMNNVYDRLELALFAVEAAGGWHS